MKNQTENNEQSSFRNRQKKKMKKRAYITKGKINRMIDIFLHPGFRQKPQLRLINGLLHAFVEQDPKASMKKFVRYNILPLLTRKQPHHRKRRRRQQFQT